MGMHISRKKASSPAHWDRYRIDSMTPNPSPAAAPNAAPYRRFGSSVGVRYAMSSMPKILNISSVTGATITRSAHTAVPKMGCIVFCKARLIHIPRSAARLKAVRKQTKSSVVFIGLGEVSKAASRALILEKRFVLGRWSSLRSRSEGDGGGGG